jgi:hypothetical protein
MINISPEEIGILKFRFTHAKSLVIHLHLILVLQNIDIFHLAILRNANIRINNPDYSSNLPYIHNFKRKTIFISNFRSHIKQDQIFKSFSSIINFPSITIDVHLEDDHYTTILEKFSMETN